MVSITEQFPSNEVPAKAKLRFGAGIARGSRRLSPTILAVDYNLEPHLRISLSGDSIEKANDRIFHQPRPLRRLSPIN